MTAQFNYTPPAIPDSEEERLQALHELDILDTGAEQSFNDLVASPSSSRIPMRMNGSAITPWSKVSSISGFTPAFRSPSTAL
jgi:hypothetical protein